MPPRVAVMHHSSSFFPLELRTLVGVCAELVWVVDSSAAPEAMLRLLRRIGPVVDTDGQDIDSTAGKLAELDTEGIVSFVDDHIVDAALLAERLGLRYHTPDVARSLVNKQLQRAVLDGAGIPGPANWAAPAGMDSAQMAEFTAQVTYPAVVKPAEGSGSRNICRVHTSGELRSVLTNGGEPGFLVEQFMEDEPNHEAWCASYLSVESVVGHGRIGHVALTGRFPLAEPFRETGNFIPAACPAERVPELLTLVDDTITALGITDSVTHTEIKLTPEGPRVIEVNGRLGGRPPFVLNAVSDVNLFQVSCRVALGEPVPIDGLAPCSGVGYLLMLQAPMEAHRLDGIDGVDEVAALDGVTSVQVHRAQGAPLDWHEGTDGKIVTIHGAVADHVGLAAVAARIRNTITVTVDTDQAEPPGTEDGPPEQTYMTGPSMARPWDSRSGGTVATQSTVDANVRGR